MSYQFYQSVFLNCFLIRDIFPFISDKIYSSLYCLSNLFYSLICRTIFPLVILCYSQSYRAPIIHNVRQILDKHFDSLLSYFSTEVVINVSVLFVFERLLGQSYSPLVREALVVIVTVISR